MNFQDLIGMLKSKKLTFEYAEKIFPEIDEPQIIELFMENEINVDSEILFIDGDAIDHELWIERDGIQYVNFFPLYL
ncbi:MAG: hypothetical protein V4615_00285, partial [Bacteroidota bacterium]